MVGNYTVTQASQILDVPAKDITDRIRKGGVKEITVDATEEGFRYLLTKGSIDQLGAGFKKTPRYENLTAERKPVAKSIILKIDPDRLQKQIEKLGIQKTVISKAIGYADNYINNATSRSTMSQKAVDELQRIFGIDPKTYLYEEKKQVVKTKPEEKKSSAVEIDTEAIRKAVCNGVMDAMVIVMKDEYISKVLTRAFVSDEVCGCINKAVYGALKGLKAQENHGNGIIPQVRK